MNVAEMFRSMVPRATMSPADEQALAQLPARLERAGYSEPKIRQLLNLQDTPHRRFDQVPGYLYTCLEEDSPGARLVRLWLLGDRVPRTQVEELLGESAVATMLKLDLLEAHGEQLAALVDLYPCEGSYIFTDPRFSRRAFTHQVYQLGTDSYVLARVTPRRPVQRALDLCTGSGVHPVVAAFHAQESWGVDINPRALEVSRLNAAANGVGDRCHFVKSDLYTEITGQFELVTANPPFVPTPVDKMELFRTGGSSGEEITEGIVRGLVEHLAVGGTFSMFTNYPVFRDSHHLDRLAQWLGGETGWGLAVLNFLHMPRELFISLHANPHAGQEEYEREFAAYLASYEQQGIDAVVAANFFVRRLPAGTPGWRAERCIPFPCSAMSGLVEEWLDVLSTPAPADWKPARHPSVGRVLVDEDGLGLVFHRDPQWAPAGTELNAEATWLVQHANGLLSVEELAREWGTPATVPVTLERLRQELILR